MRGSALEPSLSRTVQYGQPDNMDPLQELQREAMQCSLHCRDSVHTEQLLQPSSMLLEVQSLDAQLGGVCIDPEGCRHFSEGDVCGQAEQTSQPITCESPRL